MAQNSLNGLALTAIAQEALPFLQKKMAPFSLFTTDFSTDVATKGSAVATRVASAMTAQDFAHATGYTTQNATSSVVTITLDKHKFYCVGWDDSEIGNIGIDQLKATFIEPAIASICNAVQTDLLALITTAFPYTYSASVDNFGFDSLMGAAKILDNSGSNAPRAALLGTDPFYELLSDIKGVYSTGADALRKGEVGELGGISVVQLPCDEFAGTGLNGFVAGKDALCLAARLPGLPNNPGMEVATITGPGLMPVQLRSWYSADEGLYKVAAIAIYGVAAGNRPSSGVRILTTD